ncbi:MAG: OmpH family outer membrane protein [Cellvibrionaceae bacterium]|nr:OmpH family outer membrane protein [Cellvibrionaceae bacterium]
MNMMSVRILIAGLILGLAQWASAAGATKVAVLDVEALILSSEAGKSGMAQLEKNAEFAALKAKLDNLEAELKTLDEQGKNQGLTWGEDKKKEHVEKLTEVANDRREILARLNRGQEMVYMQLLNAMQPAISKALSAVIAAEGIDLVLDSKAAVHRLANADITPMVLERLNKLNAEAAEAAKKSTPAKDAKAKKN